MNALLAFAGAFTASYVVVGYLTLRLCFWIADRGERRRTS